MTGIAFAAAVAASGSAQAIVIVPTFDASVTRSPYASQIESDFKAVAAIFDKSLSSPVKVNIDVSWGSVGGSGIPGGDIGASIDNLYSGFTYSQMKGYMASSAAQNPLDTTFAAIVKGLPTTTPSGVSQYALPSAEGKALGLIAGDQPGYDGYVGFNSAVKYDFASSGAVNGEYGFEALVYHEIDEVLGRTTDLDSSSPDYRTIFDLFRYSAPRVLSFSTSAAAYFSINDGVTTLGAFNHSGGGDRGDWLSGADAQLAYLPTAAALPFGTSDWTALKALGWNQAKSAFFNDSVLAGVRSDVDYAAAAVPEPATWFAMLLGLGLAGAGVRNRPRVARA